MNSVLSISFILVTLVFAGCKKKDSNDSIFQKWQVDGFLEHSDSTTQYSSSKIYIEFKNDKTTAIELEVNTCGGAFSIEDKKLSIEGVVCTLACCDSEFSSRFLELLPKAESYFFVNEQLTLSGANNLSIRLKKPE